MCIQEWLDNKYNLFWIVNDNMRPYSNLLGDLGLSYYWLGGWLGVLSELVYMQNYYTIISSFFSHCTFWTVFSLEPFCYYYRAYVLLPISMILILPYQCSYVELLVTFLPIAKHHVFVASLFGNQMENILLSVYAENGEYIMLCTATHRNVSTGVA